MPLQLASLFQDHAVLQRGQALPIWGWAPAASIIKVQLGRDTAITISGACGQFIVRLPAREPGAPLTLQVEVPSTGEAVTINDILVGEVWLASGQSNMEWTLNKSLPLTQDSIDSADNPAIRIFTVGQRAHLAPQTTVEGSWLVSNRKTAPGFSSVAYSYARRLHAELGVPIGIIVTAWGGSAIQAWLSRSALALNADLQPWLYDYEKDVWNEDRWSVANQQAVHKDNYPANPENEGAKHGWHTPDCDDRDWETHLLPGNWQDAGHSYSGVFWFRREIEIPDAWIGRELLLEPGAIDKQDVTYVNGVEVGRTGTNFEEDHWDTPRHYRVPAETVITNRLIIAVRVYSFLYHGGITGPANLMRVSVQGSEESAIPLSGEWRARCEHNFGRVSALQRMGHLERNTPHILYDNMLAPIAPYAVRGAIWYQGESNAGDGRLYARMLRDLILDWRRLWGNPTFGFHIVQLPGYQRATEYDNSSCWARIREAQLECTSLVGVGIAVTLDLGEADNLHPKRKIPVGERLAASALSLTYKRAGAPCGPLFDRVEREGAALRCLFLHASSGLATRDGKAPACVYVASADRQFVRGHARIEGTTLLVSHPSGETALAIRYGWSDNPESANLSDSEGRLASPFRSDRWPDAHPA